MKLNSLASIVVLLSTLAGTASAFEFEPAVALTIGEKVGNLSVDDIRINLSGKSVTIKGRVDNPRTTPVRNGYFAYTPLFNRMGVGEENYSKDFKEFRVAINEQPVLLSEERRGFFLGRDITTLLRQAGLDPLPSENADSLKVKKLSHHIGFDIQNGLEWQGFVSYSFTPTFAPKSSSTIKIAYTALPQFSLEKVGGEQFAQIISQHSGNAGSLGQAIRSNHPDAEYVLIERYDIPASFFDGKTVFVKVSQPPTNWAGVHPFASLACGLETDSPSLTSISGRIVASPDARLSILVISSPS